MNEHDAREDQGEDQGEDESGGDVLDPVTVEFIDELNSKKQHVGETLSGPGDQVLEQLTDTEIFYYHYRELGGHVLDSDPDDPDPDSEHPEAPPGKRARTN